MATHRRLPAARRNRCGLPYDGAVVVRPEDLAQAYRLRERRQHGAHDDATGWVLEGSGRGSSRRGTTPPSYRKRPDVTDDNAVVAALGLVVPPATRMAALVHGLAADPTDSAATDHLDPITSPAARARRSGPWRRQRPQSAAPARR
jgi:hypothetical protein